MSGKDGIAGAWDDCPEMSNGWWHRDHVLTRLALQHHVLLGGEQHIGELWWNPDLEALVRRFRANIRGYGPCGECWCASARIAHECSAFAPGKEPKAEPVDCLIR